MARPLTEEDKGAIDEALGRLEELEEVIIRSQEAGIDVAAQEKRRLELMQRLRAIRAAFFPGE